MVKSVAGPVTVAICLTPEPLGVLLRAVGNRHNMTSKLAIKPGGTIDGPEDHWILEVSEAPWYTSEVAAYILGFLDAPGISGATAGVTVPEP